ncbi:MAG: type II secretion system F family protein, partial [Candidatus Paceibacteria bacterium]
MATKVAQKSKDSPKDIKQNKGFFDRLKSRMTDDKRTMLNNLAILIDSGMGIRSALRSLEDNTRHKKLKKQLAKIRGDIEDGKPLWKAFDKHSFAPPYIISLIRIGEKSGNLEEILEDAVQTLEKEKKHKSQLRSAMFYPTFILFMALIVTIGLTWFVLPRLGRVFNSLNADLPTITKVLLSAGDIMSQYGVYIVPAAFLVVLTIIFFLFFFPPTKGIGQWILFHIPVIHKLIMYTEVSR